MKKEVLFSVLSRLLVGLGAVFTFNSVSYATLLNLDALLEGRVDGEIIELFKKTEELQIGGSNTYGNKTIDKKGEVGPVGELDPRILILNPDPLAHLPSERILGILGSGFDVHLVQKLMAICDRYSHRFRKVYINNLGFALPIADRTRLVLHVSDEKTELTDISEEQESYFRNPVETTRVALEDGIFTYARAAHDPDFQTYLRSVGSDVPSNIYGMYFGMLVPGGQFLFKSASLYDLKSVFFLGFLKSTAKERRREHREPVRLEMGPGEIDKYMKCKRKEDEKLFQKVLSKLKKIGDLCSINKNEFDVGSINAEWRLDSRLNIKSQVYLLKGAGFRNVNVSFGKFKDWGFSKTPREEGVFSLVLSAEK